jgi:hypothetical protein
MFRIRRIQRPRELTPGPPHQSEHQHSLPHTGPVELVVQQPHDLRDPIDKHQVEEQFNERCALILW